MTGELGQGGPRYGTAGGPRAWKGEGPADRCGSQGTQATGRQVRAAPSPGIWVSGRRMGLHYSPRSESSPRACGRGGRAGAPRDCTHAQVRGVEPRLLQHKPGWRQGVTRSHPLTLEGRTWEHRKQTDYLDLGPGAPPVQAPCSADVGTGEHPGPLEKPQFPSGLVKSLLLWDPT